MSWKKFLLIFLIVLIAVVAGVFLLKKDERVISKTDFSIRMPQLWQETEAMEGVLAMATAANNSSNSTANSYIEYLTVTKATDNLEGHKISEYGKYVEDSLAAISSESKVISKVEEKIGRRDACLMEINAVNVVDSNFKSLMALVVGNNGDIWVVSFSCSPEAWETYKPMFYESVRSFVVKK